MLVPVAEFDLRTTVPIDLAARTEALDRRAVHVIEDAHQLAALQDAWARRAPSIPLVRIDNDGGVTSSIARFVRSQLDGREFDEVRVLIGRVRLRRRLHRLLHDRTADSLVDALSGIPGVVIATSTVGTT